MAIVPENEKIPVQPLLDFIERRGGVGRLPGMGVWSAIPPSMETAGSSGRTTHLQSVDRTDVEAERSQRLHQILLRAEKRGWISLHTADAICCDELQVHPMAVYGDAWWDFGAPVGINEGRWVERWAQERSLTDLRAAA